MAARLFWVQKIMCSTHIIPIFLLMEHQLHNILLIILTISTFFVFLSQNPIQSILYLVLTFSSAAGLLILIHVEFLGLLFLIIYVGAIAILFLFVIMMINVKNLVRFNFFYTLMFMLVALVIIMKPFYINLYSNFNDISLLDGITPFFNVDIMHNIIIFGQVLYNYYLSCVLLAGFILLLALVGSVVLTLNFSKVTGNEIISRQLSRSKHSLNYYIN